ncbi:tetratricopeptide repeat protein [Prosthecobacter sp.]|uniref:tetratricopeptide repeat protein n=1 Tax=Prosthecobacter sp. TaxID=1965333 RepID=UPI003784B82C
MKLPSSCTFALLLLSFSCGPGVLPAAEDAGKATAKEAARKAEDAVTALREVGKIDDAEKAAQALLQARTQELGAEAADTLRARLLVAQLLIDHSREPEAEAQLRALLPLLARVTGENSRYHLLCQSMLATALLEQDKNAEVLELCRAIIPVQQQALGPADEVTLKTRRLLARALFAKGKTAQATQEHRDILELCLRTLGPEAKETLRTRLAMTGADSALHETEAAERALRELLPAMVKVFGEENSETQACVFAMARALRAGEKYEEAEAQWRRWLEIATRLHGPEDSFTLHIRQELAADLEAQDKDAEAAQQYEAVLAIQERKLGPEDKATLKTCHTLALNLKKQKKPAEALAYARRALAGRIKTLGPDANDTDASQRLANQLAYATPGGLAQLGEVPLRRGQKRRPVAMVDGALIYADELKETIDAQEQVIRYRYTSDPDPERMEQELAELRREALGNLIDKHLLLNEFRRIGGEIKPGFVDQDIDDIIKNSFKGSREAFDKELEKGGLTYAEFRRLREHMIIMNVMRSRIAGEIEVTDEEAHDYFDKNKQRWAPPQQVKISTLTIPTSQPDARTRAETLHKEIAAGGDFAAAARTSSQDSHADSGGAWDWMALSDFTAGVRKAVDTTPKGQISPLIEQGTSFIILRVDDRLSPAPPAFKKVKDEVIKVLKDEKTKDRIDYKVNKLHEKADIQKMDAV